MNNHYYTLANFTTGILAAASGFTMTLMEQVEIGIRIGTSFLGFVIALLTIRNLWRNRKKHE